MVKMTRWLRHSFMPPWILRRKFPKSVLNQIELAITRSERTHSGELRFAIEHALPPLWVWRGQTALQRAIEVFSQLRVWDTEENSGVLIYLLLADREVHILADRGITKRIPPTQWQAIAEAMQNHFRLGDFQQGSLLGIEQITGLLSEHFPVPATDHPNQLPNAPVIIR